MRVKASRLLALIAYGAMLGGHVQAQNLKPGVAAYVGDWRILDEDVDRMWLEQDPASYERIRRDSYEARRRALDALIVNRMLGAEASARGVEVEDLLVEAASRLARPVTGVEIAAFLASNPLPAAGSEVGIALVRALLQKRSQEIAQQEYLETLRRTRSSLVQVFLEPPRVPLSRREQNPTRGPVGAPVEVMVFSDFQCPFCQKAEPVLARLLQRFPEQVRLVWRHYPLSIHAEARGAAEAAQCAHGQGRFWDYHDALFSDQSRLQPRSLTETAQRLGLDAAAFAECMTAHVHAADVAADVEAGERAGVSGTPTVFVNGVALVGALPYEVYERAVSEELQRREQR